MDLGYNSIEELPQNIGNLSNLTTLFLDNNFLIHIPNSICDLNIEFDNPYNFMIDNNDLCVENMPSCIAVTEILGYQDCVDLQKQDHINH